MASLTRWVLAHRKLVVAFWVLLTLVGIAPDNIIDLFLHFAVGVEPAFDDLNAIEVGADRVLERSHEERRRLPLQRGGDAHHSLTICAVFLAAIEPDEVRALPEHHVVVFAREVALGPLELDDAGPRVRQAPGSHGCRHGLIDRHDEGAGERS